MRTDLELVASRRCESDVNKPSNAKLLTPVKDNMAFDMIYVEDNAFQYDSCQRHYNFQYDCCNR